MLLQRKEPEGGSPQALKTASSTLAVQRVTSTDGLIPNSSNPVDRARMASAAVDWLWRLERREKAKRPIKTPIDALRVYDLARLCTYRFGPEFPEDDCGRSDLLIIFHHLARLSDADKRMRSFARAKAPWLSSTELELMIGYVARYPRYWSADELAEELQLRLHDRELLQIKTIGCVDLNLRQRQDLRRKRKRDREEERRRASGARPREQYEGNSDNRTKPWKKLRMSRAKWFRLGKPRS